MAMEIATPIHAPVTSPASNLIISATTAVETQKKNRIQVSNTKKPLFFYVNLAKVVQKYPLIYHNNGFLVSKQPFFIYESRECKNWSFIHVYLMQRYIQQHNEVELSALGMGRCQHGRI